MWKRLERKISFFRLFIYLFILSFAFLVFFLLLFLLSAFFSIRIFLSAFPIRILHLQISGPRPAKIYSALSFDRINFFNMANLLLLSRKAFVMCYCFRAPKKTFFFDACQSDCQIVRPALVSGTPNRKKPYNKHLISLVFSVRTVNYGSSFFPSIYGPRAFIAFSIALDSLQR